MQHIVNINRKPPTPYVYVGRAMPSAKEREALPASPLGNPFRLGGKRSPDEIARVLKEYRQWLFAKIKAEDESVMLLLRKIGEDTTLACWCVEMEGEEIYTGAERCHAQVIMKAWRWWTAAAL